ncbi:MAG: hypothetical protein ACYTEU_07595 [Planctomycetota bacterium]|jgi:hypothetical protein
MKSFKNEIVSRIGPLKDILKNLLELTWLLFAALQWIVSFVAPLILVFSVVYLFIGKSLKAECLLVDTNLLSLKGLFYSYLYIIVYAAFAYYYIFKIRKAKEPTITYKCCLMGLYLSLGLALACKAELAEHQYILKNIHYSETKVNLYDADTKELLIDNTSFSISGKTSGQILPLMFSSVGSNKKGFCFRLIHIEPAVVTFSVPGYESKTVFVGTEEGEQTISVYLEKEKLKDPNSISKP